MKKGIKGIIFITFSLFLLSVVICFSMKTDSFAKEQDKAYVSIEKFTIGQGFVVEPMIVNITDGELVSNVIVRALDKKGLKPHVEENTSYGWYLVGIYGVDSGNGHIPKCITEDTKGKVTDDLILPAKTKNIVYPDLEEFSYQTTESGTTTGWFYYMNNQAPGVGMGNRKVHNEDVIRLRFTLYDGDLELTGDLDHIIKRLAIYKEYKNICDNEGYASAYQNALKVVANMDSTEEELNEVYNALPTEEQIAQYVDIYNTRMAQNLMDRIDAIGEVTLDKEEILITDLTTRKRRKYPRLHCAYCRMPKPGFFL